MVPAALAALCFPRGWGQQSEPDEGGGLPGAPLPVGIWHWGDTLGLLCSSQSSVPTGAEKPGAVGPGGLPGSGTVQGAALGAQDWSLECRLGEQRAGGRSLSLCRGKSDSRGRACPTGTGGLPGELAGGTGPWKLLGERGRRADGPRPAGAWLIRVTPPLSAQYSKAPPSHPRTLSQKGVLVLAMCQNQPGPPSWCTFQPESHTSVLYPDGHHGLRTNSDFCTKTKGSWGLGCRGHINTGPGSPQPQNTVPEGPCLPPPSQNSRRKSLSTHFLQQLPGDPGDGRK